MPSIQKLIENSSKGLDREMAREMELKVKFTYYGKLSQGWKHVRTLLRYGKLLFGDNMSVHLFDGTQITNDEGSDA